jgi:hypothetical protein
VLYLTGSGLSPKRITLLLACPQIGVLATPVSLHLAYVRPFAGRWAADNGCYAQGAKFRMDAFMAWLTKFSELAPSCLFATAPDVVADAKATWARSMPAFGPIRAAGYKVALVAQNGIEDMDLDWSAFDAVFLGGDTRWKLSAAADGVAREAKRRGRWVHMGRVNSFKRLEVAQRFGCDSVDGNYLGFGPDANLPRLVRWMERLGVTMSLPL